MTIEAYILTSLSIAAAKFLFKKYLGEDGQIVAAGGEVVAHEGIFGEAGDVVVDVLADVAKGKIKDTLERLEAVGDIRKYGLKVVRQIKQQLEKEEHENPLVDANAIAKELMVTLQTDVSVASLLKQDLDPRRVVDAFSSTRPLQKGVLNLDSDLAYERMLEHAARCLVGVAGQLPDFQASAVAESLTRLRTIDGNIDKVLQQLANVTSEVARLASPGDPQRFEIEYRQAVAANFDYVELFGVTIPPELKRFQLTKAFVSLNLQRKSAEGENESENSGPNENLLSCEAVFDRLQPDDCRLLIRGAAGSGKTTLMRWVAISAANIFTPKWEVTNWLTAGMMLHEFIQLYETNYKARSNISCRNTVWRYGINDLRCKSTTKAAQDKPARVALSDFDLFLEPPRSWRTQVPFVVLLRHCQEGKLPRAEEFPKLIGEGIGQPPADWVRTILKEGRGLVLIDGVDEVPPDQRDEVVRGLEQLTIHYPKSYFVVTTRPEAVPADWLSKLGFREAHVNPMAGDDVKQLIARWYEVAQRYYRPVGRIEDLSGRRQDLLHQLETNDSLRPLATNPLLCAMICALHLNSSGTLPESQSALCDQLCDMLIHRREREQQILDDKPFPPAYVGLSVDQKRTLVQDLAVYMVQEGRSALSFDLAEERIAKRLAGFKDRTAADASIVLKGLLERSGILREPVPGQLDFLHNTFKEFLAGEFFASERMENSLLEHVFAPSEASESWRRVTLFAAGSRRGPEGFTCNLIKQLLVKSEPVDGKAIKSKPRRTKKDVLSDPVRLRNLLALQCQVVADGRGLPTEIKSELEALVKDLFPPRTLSDAESLATLRDLAVPYLKRSANKRLSVEAAARCVRALRLINTSTSQSAIRDYMDMDGVDVVEELAQAMNPLHIPAVQRIIQTPYRTFQNPKCRISEGIRQRICDLSPLSVLSSSISELNLYQTRVSDITLLKECKRLVALNVAGSLVSDISPLESLNSLRQLAIDLTQVADVEPLRQLLLLDGLSLTGTNVDDVAALGSLVELTTLSVAQTKITDITPIRNMKIMKTLNLFRNRISDIYPLEGLMDLRWLDLGHTDVSDITALRGVDRLRILNLNSTQVDSVAPLAGLHSLEEVNVVGTQVKDITALKECGMLKTVYVSNPDVELPPKFANDTVKVLFLVENKVTELEWRTR